MRFESTQRSGHVKIVVYPGGRRREFTLPYTTDDPAEIALLRTVPGVHEVRTERRVRSEAKIVEDKPHDVEVSNDSNS